MNLCEICGCTAIVLQASPTPPSDTSAVSTNDVPLHHTLSRTVCHLNSLKLRERYPLDHQVKEWHVEELYLGYNFTPNESPTQYSFSFLNSVAFVHLRLLSLQGNFLSSIEPLRWLQTSQLQQLYLSKDVWYGSFNIYHCFYYNSICDLIFDEHTLGHNQLRDVRVLFSRCSFEQLKVVHLHSNPILEVSTRGFFPQKAIIYFETSPQDECTFQDLRPLRAKYHPKRIVAYSSQRINLNDLTDESSLTYNDYQFNND